MPIVKKKSLVNRNRPAKVSDVGRNLSLIAITIIKLYILKFIRNSQKLDTTKIPYNRLMVINEVWYIDAMEY